MRHVGEGVERVKTVVIRDSVYIKTESKPLCQVFLPKRYPYIVRVVSLKEEK